MNCVIELAPIIIIKLHVERIICSTKAMQLVFHNEKNHPPDFIRCVVEDFYDKHMAKEKGSAY